MGGNTVHSVKERACRSLAGGMGEYNVFTPWEEEVRVAVWPVGIESLRLSEVAELPHSRQVRERESL